MTQQQAPARADDASGWRDAVVVTGAAALIRLFFAWRLPLFPDETYYWEWSRRLAGGYFDHPPLIALLIRAGTPRAVRALGALGIRFFPVAAGAIASLAAAAIARRLGGGAAARTAAVVFALMPLAASGLVLATPDAPLLAASACGLYAVTRALQSPPRSRASLRWWSLAGIALGLAFASKYTSILLPVSIVVAVIVRPSLRARLREPGPYVACLLATLVFLPVLYWNATHEWISFRFQIQHGLGAPRGSPLQRELDLVGGQLALVSPILFALLAAAVWRTLRRPLDDVRFALAVVALGSWVFFAYSAVRRPVEANWPAPSYIPAVVLLAALSPEAAWSKWIRRGAALAAVMVAVIYLHALHPILPIPARRDPTARNAGWSAVARQVDSVRTMLDRRAGGPLGLVEQPRGPAAPRAWVGADRYQEVSELTYHLGSPAFCVCLGGRHNQYELWPGFAGVARAGDALVLLLDETTDAHPTATRLAPYFTSVARGAPAPLLRGDDTVAVRRIWVLTGYRGGWPSRAEP
jgi:4-amino-4-deoxy-L-arabinose transferase-like glycosyltransferase